MEWVNVPEPETFQPEGHANEPKVQELDTLYPPTAKHEPSGALISIKASPAQLPSLLVLSSPM